MSEEFMVVSKDLFLDLKALNLVNEKATIKNGDAIRRISELYQITMDIIDNGTVMCDSLFHITATTIVRMLEKSEIIKKINDEIKGPIIEYVEFYVSSKFESIFRARALLNKTKRIMSTQQEG